jgi:magnesium chelatase family protein
MKLAKSHAISLLGLTGTPIEVEVDISAQLPAFVLVGLPDASLNEATSRVRAACSNSGFGLPSQKVLVNLSPAAVPKSGSSFDLAIAVGVVSAMGKIPAEALEGICLIGELGLDGAVRPVLGVLPMCLAARRAGFRKVLVPAANYAEALLVDGITSVGVVSLRHVVGLLVGAEDAATLALLPLEASPTSGTTPRGSSDRDLRDVVGQEEAVEGLIVAAAGGHHLSMIGSPGAGKTMLAERLPTILPPLDHEQALEVAAIESISGLTSFANPLSLEPRFHAPHHGASMASIIGGGVGTPRPGAVSLSHNGVLFLDEAPEFNSNVLESLRQTLESGVSVIHRAGGVATFPARFQLVLAANPCPCGNFGSINKECLCSFVARRRYGAKLSGPLRDRIDIRLDVKPVRNLSGTLGDVKSIDSKTALARVESARNIARERLRKSGYSRNAQVPGSVIKAQFNPGKTALAQLERQLSSGKTSMRGYDRCLRVAWTIADLAGATVPTAEHVAQAVSLRGPDQMIGVA